MVTGYGCSASRHGVPGWTSSFTLDSEAEQMTDEERGNRPEHDDGVSQRLDQVPDELPPELKEELEKDIERLEHVGFTDATVKTRTDLRAWWRWATFGTALILSLFHVYTAVFGLLPSQEQRSFHLAFGLGLIFLHY